LNLEEEIVEIHGGDIFLLCSDGLTKEVSDQEICGALIPGDCQHASEDLVNMALKRGGRDNISAIVVCAEDPYGPDKTLFNPAL
jgi:protein phosphatase